MIAKCFLFIKIGQSAHDFSDIWLTIHSLLGHFSTKYEGEKEKGTHAGITSYNELRQEKL